MNNYHKIYLAKLLSLVDKKKIQKKKFRVLADPVNGAASEILPWLLEQLNCQVVRLNCETDRLPGREPEPRKKTLIKTAQVVVKNHCDLGIATDMDADRVLFIDETGEVLSEDLTGVILATNKKILVTPINSSGLFKAEAKKWGGKVIDCQVGPPEISAAIKIYHADFAYEESGKYFFCQHFNWADGLLAGIKMLEIMAQRQMSLSQIRKSYPEYFQEKQAIKCAWERMPRRWVGEGEKKVMGDSFMFIRASGTEPLIRVFSDSPCRSRAAGLARQGVKIVEKELLK